jgi:uncharacterized protein (TIGR00369 family)
MTQAPNDVSPTARASGGIVRGPTTIADLNALSEGTAMQPLGIVFTEIGPDYLRGTMPVDARTRQPYGLLHGGASVLLAETLGSTAGGLCTGPGQGVVGIEINANHLAGVRDLKHELDAYDDFCDYRDHEARRRGLQPDKLGRADWLESRRDELVDRMHTRRERDFGTGYGSSSGYASKQTSYTRGWRPGVFKFG